MVLDTLIPSSADLAGDPAMISRAEALRPIVEAAADEIEDKRRLPPALLDKLHEARLFRLLLPRSSNGIETDPITFFHVIETIARADASTAWCLSQAGGCAMSAAYLDLRVTASDQFALTDHFVPASHAITRDVITRESETECREPGPLYRMSAMTCYEVGFAGVALGIARASLDSFVDVAKNKIPRGKKSPLRDNAVVQTNLAQVEVGIRSARAFLLQSMVDIWKQISAGDRLTVDHRITIRMASTNAIHKAREAVDFAYNAAGATAIFESHPLERRFRDIHTVTQQLQGRLSHFETVGAWMMGADADLTFV